MTQRPFFDESFQPTTELLKNIFGEANKFSDELNALAVGFRKEWNFSKSSGWMQKVHDDKKALYYFIPLNDSFIISVAIREQEKAEFLFDENLSDLFDQLNDSKKYSEGYVMKFLINDETSFSKFRPFIVKLIEKRK